MHLAVGQRRDRIDDRAVGAMAHDHHGAPGQVRIACDDAAIVQVAVEHRRLARIEVPAHRRMNAVGADQEIALRFAGRRT